MQTYTEPDILHMAACLAFILSGVICGIIRWFHMCHPYDQHADFFYPARKGAFLIYSGLLLLLPYLFKVNDEFSWFYARTFGILYYPAIYAWLVLRYFGGKLYYKSPRFLIFEMPTLILILFLLLGCSSLYHLSSSSTLYYLVGTWGIVLVGHLLKTLMWLRRKIDRYHYERYSNEDDFPYRFAERFLFTPTLIVTFMWLIFITDSRDVKMYVDYGMTIYNVAFLCVILHPQRQLMADDRNQILERIEEEECIRVQVSLEAEENSDEETNEVIYEATESSVQYFNAEERNSKELEQNKNVRLTDEKLRYYQDLVIHELRDNQVFLDCHYNLTKLSESIRVGRTYASLVCKSLGGFYNLVNKYRLDYAEQYQREHPEATQDKVALQSGFKDRKAFYRAKSTDNHESNY